jgi:hypothetical protein
MFVTSRPVCCSLGLKPTQYGLHKEQSETSPSSIRTVALRLHGWIFWLLFWRIKQIGELYSGGFPFSYRPAYYAVIVISLLQS